jgi:hypothetical protein
MLGYSDFRWKGDKLLAGSKNTGQDHYRFPVARYVSSRISPRHCLRDDQPDQSKRRRYQHRSPPSQSGGQKNPRRGIPEQLF